MTNPRFSSFSKILNIENKIQIEVPASHKFIRYDNEDVKNSIEEFVQDYEGMEIDLYLVGPKKYVDLEKAIIDGEDPMSLTGIGRVLGISRDRVRNLLRDGLKGLRRLGDAVEDYVAC